MTIEILLALAGFAFVTSITPGPNNLMLLASGANFGFRRSVPHMLGIGIGFTAMVAGVGVGLMGLFELFPVLHSVLKVGAVAYMLYLAWKIANARAPKGTSDEVAPMTFWQAAAFQWVNPKAWSMALTAIAAYAPDRTLLAVVVVAAVFGMVNLPSVSVWTVLGGQMRRLLSRPKHLILFNWTMAGLLILSLIPVLMA